MSSISGEKLAYITTTIAVAIAQQCDAEDLAILSSMFDAISDILDIFILQQEGLEEIQSNTNNTNNK